MKEIEQNINKNQICTFTEIDKTRLPILAKAYAEVFAGEPWNEVSKCDNCGEFSKYDPKEKTVCECGGCFKLEAYPEEETSKYINYELNKDYAIGLIANDYTSTNKNIKAFGWGYGLSTEIFIKQKYKQPYMQGIIRDLFVENDNFFYISEVGVLSIYRGSGLGTNITKTLIEYGKTYYSNFILRTNEDSPMRYIAEKLGMFAMLGLNTGIKDMENTSRVLYTLKK